MPGCQRGEEIRVYEVPRQEPIVSRPVQKMGDPRRLIAAMYYKGDETWVFKVDGPDKALAPHKDTIETFLRSVHFDKEKGPTWTLPNEWKELPAKGERHTTLALPGDLELAVTKFPKQDVLANVNRWRKQVGLAPVREADLEKSVKKVDIQGVTAYFVDVVGADQRLPQMPAFSVPTKFDLPDKWKKAKSTVAIYAYELSEGGKTAKLTATFLPGEGGGLIANIQRWRDEIKLPRASEEQLRKEATKIDIDGRAGYFVDLRNPQSSGNNRTLGVLIIGEQVSWFFKMFGPEDLIECQKPVFEAYLRSIRFEEPKGK